MISNDNSCIYNISAKIDPSQINDIKIYIKGAVYTFCNNNREDRNHSKWFSIYNIFGEKNYYWNEPHLCVYDYYSKLLGIDHKQSQVRAARDLGLLLKKVLSEDNRIYEFSKIQRHFNVKKYRLID